MYLKHVIFNMQSISGNINLLFKCLGIIVNLYFFKPKLFIWEEYQEENPYTRIQKLFKFCLLKEIGRNGGVHL